MKYLIKWINYDLEDDAWKNLSKLDNAKKLIENYEKLNAFMIFTFSKNVNRKSKRRSRHQR